MHRELDTEALVPKVPKSNFLRTVIPIGTGHRIPDMLLRAPDTGHWPLMTLMNKKFIVLDTGPDTRPDTGHQ